MTEKMVTGVIDGDAPLIVVLDTSASMNTADAPGQQTRLTHAKERVSELFKRLPKHTKVTLLTAGAGAQVVCEDASAIDARAALWLIDAAAARADFGAALEWCCLNYTGKATVLVLADAKADDQARYEAWRGYDQHQGQRFHIVELALHGDAPGQMLEDYEWRLHTHTQSDKPEAERPKAATVPPSITPPSKPEAPPTRNALHHKPAPAAYGKSAPPKKSK